MGLFLFNLFPYGIHDNMLMEILLIMGTFKYYFKFECVVCVYEMESLSYMAH